ncbi:MAG: UDP-N-acetylmuramate--L-alanine ligase, partial [Patescibacteria group bacterium]
MLPFDFKNINFIHFVGVGGIGISALAKFFLAQGKSVSGSDIADSAIIKDVKQMGVKVNIGHKIENLDAKTQLVIVSNAIPENNPEILEAKKRDLPIISQFEALGLLSAGSRTIAIAGTNGKSTTTAMTGLILEESRMDPTVFVGSFLPQWKGNLRVGKLNTFVVEADEYQRKFLSLVPQILALTNIEADHLDYYKDLEDIKSAFKELIKKVETNGTAIYNADDPTSLDALNSSVIPAEAGIQIINYGKNGKEVKLLSVDVREQKQIVKINFFGKPEEFELRVPGLFNVYNALAAAACAGVLGIDFPTIALALGKYKGIWRRFELRGTAGKTLIISDYAHHPTALLATMKAAREFYPGKKILLVFQPHQYRRTKLLFEDFITALSAADPDKLILAEVYDVAGREDADKSVGSKQLADKISEELPNTVYAANLEETEKLIRADLPNFDIVIVMGAGDIDG